MSALLSLPVVLPVLFIAAAVLSAVQPERPVVRVLARIVWSVAILLTLACVAVVWWFFTSFELTW